MRTTTLTTLLALLALATVPAEAQRAVAAGTNRAEIRLTAGFEVPQVLVLRQTGAPVATARAAGYTEYQMAYTVAANLRWTLTAAELPEGVTLRTEDGTFQTEVGTTLGQGQATNATEQLLTVRVATGTPATWTEALRLELRGR